MAGPELRVRRAALPHQRRGCRRRAGAKRGGEDALFLGTGADLLPESQAAVRVGVGMPLLAFGVRAHRLGTLDLQLAKNAVHGVLHSLAGSESVLPLAGAGGLGLVCGKTSISSLSLFLAQQRRGRA